MPPRGSRRVRFRASLWILGVGLAFALAAALPGFLPPGTLDSERLRLDSSRANLESFDDSGGYRIELGVLEAGDRVNVSFSLLRVGNVTVRESSELQGARAPRPDDGGALAREHAQTGNLTFVAPGAGEYALAIESPGEPAVTGVVLLAWDPPQEAPRNPIFFGLAKGLARLTVGLAVVALVLDLLRGRRHRSGAS